MLSRETQISYSLLAPDRFRANDSTSRIYCCLNLFIENGDKPLFTKTIILTIELFA